MVPVLVESLIVTSDKKKVELLFARLSAETNISQETE